MNNPCEIVRYRPEHKGQVAALQAHLWTRDASLAARYLEWKYEENPYVTEPLIYLAIHGSELVGMRGFYGAKWELGQPQEVQTVLVADDFVIAPQHRDQGLATQIMKAAFEDLAKRGYRHVFNLSGGQVTVLGSLAMGWKSAGPLKPVCRETGPTWDRRLRDLLKQHPLSSGRAGSPLPDSVEDGQPFAHFDRVVRLRTNGPEPLELEPLPDAMSDLVSRLGHDGRIRHVRDREYFDWRFRNPLSIYRFLYVGDARLEGYLVLKCAHPAALERQRVNIVDLEASDPMLRITLLDAAIESGQFAELFAWAATFTDAAQEYLSSTGFKPTDLESRAHGCPTVLVKPLVPESADRDWVLGNRRLTALADWDMRMLYTMAG